LLPARTQGVRLERKKEAALLNTLKRPYLIKRLRITPVSCEGIPCSPCVAAGDRVEAGARVAIPADARGIPVFSGISGKVETVGKRSLPEGGEESFIEIAAESDFKQAPPKFVTPRADAESLSGPDLLNLFCELGLVVTDGTNEPLRRRLETEGKPPRTIVINGCEPEPYVSSENILMTGHLPEVLKGAELLRKASGAERVVFLIEDAERELFELVKSKIYLLKAASFEVFKVPAIYPMGAADFLPAEFSLDSRILNASTAHAAYEAVYFGKPFFERIVTVAGECVAEPRNLWLPFGVSFREAVRACKGFLREPARLIAGGPMRGTAQRGDGTAVVTPATNAILALPAEIAGERREEPCIRCNRCVDTCPVFLSPATITLAAETGEFGIAAEWRVKDCIECGICAYVCPSKRPMIDLIHQAKAGL